jgi:hypothetical protein
MSDMAVMDVAALSPATRHGSNNSLTIMSNNNNHNSSNGDFNSVVEGDADVSSTSKISPHHEIGIDTAAEISHSLYANNSGDNGSNHNHNNNHPSSATTSLSSPLFGSISNCIPNAARAIASMLSGTVVAQVTHIQPNQQHADNNHDGDDIESSATAAAAAAKVVSEVMYATNNLLSSSDNAVDDYSSDHQQHSITAAVSDVTTTAASSSSSNSNNYSNDNDNVVHHQNSSSSSNCDNLQMNTSSSSTTTVSHIVVSLENDHYKEIMWKHFRILGKSKDIDLSKIGNEILIEFKQQMVGSGGGKFYKRERGLVIEIDDNKALCSEYTPFNIIYIYNDSSRFVVPFFPMFFFRFLYYTRTHAFFLLFQQICIFYLCIILQRLMLILADE